MLNKNNNPTYLVSSFQKSSLLAVITTAILMSIMLIILEFHTFSIEVEQLEEKHPDVIVQLTSRFNDTKKLNIDTTYLNILSKPYSNAELLSCIRNALDKIKTPLNEDNG